MMKLVTNAQPANKTLNANARIEFRRVNAAGFTLIELMISIALVLFLILGINQVFEYTTKAVGAGEAINAAIRDSRAAQATFASDFSAMVPPGTGPTDSACLVINSQAAYAYANAKDLAAEGKIDPGRRTFNSYGVYNIPAGAPYQDLANSGDFGDPAVLGDTVYPFMYNNRNHRLDVMSFFARDLFRRQTGNPGTYAANMAGTEAWIWYGHLWLPDNNGKYPAGSSNDPTPQTFPCNGSPATNPNNFFGSKLVLGRMAVILNPADSSGYIYDQSGVPQSYVNTGSVSYLSPIDPNSPVNAAGGTENDTNNKYMYQARFDLANTSINTFRNNLSAFLSAHPTNSTAPNTWWWVSLLDGFGNNERFQCNPFVSKPMQASDMAHASPYFIGGCSQFIVEYAGDYLTQENDPQATTASSGHNYGDLISAAPDGQVDYQIITDLSGLKRKQIIWYGLPRNTSGLAGCNILQGDVAPLTYWMDAPPAFGGLGLGTSYSHEHVQPILDVANDLTSMRANSQYLCAWGPNDIKPKLIRITLTVDDPTGRLPEGQTYQYVFGVP